MSEIGGRNEVGQPLSEASSPAAAWWKRIAFLPDPPVLRPSLALPNVRIPVNFQRGRKKRPSTAVSAQAQVLMVDSSRRSRHILLMKLIDERLIRQKKVTSVMGARKKDEEKEVEEGEEEEDEEDEQEKKGKKRGAEILKERAAGPVDG